MRKFILIVGLIIFVCVISLLVGYQILTKLQTKNVRTLGWEGEHNLWATSMFGNIRWDVNDGIITYRALRPDSIDHFFLSQEGNLWGYGYGVWKFKSGEWIDMGEETGLERGVVYDMLQANDGTIWIATLHGVKKWNSDIGQWETTVINKPSRTLVEASDNSLWVGLIDDGVIRLNSDKQTHWTMSDNLTDNRIRSMLSANDGTIWVGTSNGINHWNGNSWQGWKDLGYPDPDGLTIFRLLESSDGAVWADTSQDFAKWENGQWTTYPRSPFCGNSYSFLETDDSGLWAGCATGIFRWTGTNWHEYDQSEGLIDNSFGHLIYGANGILYASTKGGMYEYIAEQDHWRSFPDR